jgi:uncharacterized repeat protein (TIGR03803 family)
VIFKVDHYGYEKVLHTFGLTDGANPTGDLVVDDQGNLYGSTVTGGNLSRCAGSGCGVIFKLEPSGQLTSLHVFTGPGNGDGANPTHALTKDSEGNLYGTTENGGLTNCFYRDSDEAVVTDVPGCGVVYKLDPSGETQIHLFNSPPDGSDARSALIQDAAGNFYGTTFYGGEYRSGTVFKLDSGSNETVLYNFQGASDGANPWGGLVEDALGNWTCPDF